MSDQHPALRLARDEPPRDRELDDPDLLAWLLDESLGLAFARSYEDLAAWCDGRGVPADPPLARYAVALAHAQDLLGHLALDKVRDIGLDV
jgi:hypothetical protein